MWLVLCDRSDLPALWAFRGLAARGLKPLELVTSEALAYALCWEHRISSDGGSVAVELGDGRRIDGAEVHGVLNRLVAIPDHHLRRAAESDREYAAHELHAFFVSWLAALPCRVVNRATPQGLCGGWRNRSEWLALAAAAGLPTVPLRLSDETSDNRLAPPVRTVLVVGGQPFEAPATLRSGCARFAELAGADVFGVELAASGLVSGGTPLPDLRLGGDRALDLLAEVLR
jgi:hypothetical protein